MADSQVPWGVEALSGKISEPAWQSKPSWYLIATEDRMIPPPAQREMSARAGSTVQEAAGSHAIYVSQPEAVAEIIEKAASEGDVGHALSIALGEAREHLSRAPWARAARAPAGCWSHSHVPAWQHLSLLSPASAWQTQRMVCRPGHMGRRWAVLALAALLALICASPAQALSQWFIRPTHRDPAGNFVWMGLFQPTAALGHRAWLISGTRHRSSREMTDAGTWTAVQVEGGYTFMNRHSGKCLDISGPSQDNGTPVHQWNCHGGRSQVWRTPIAFKMGDVEERRIVNAYSNKCLDVPNWRVNDGAWLQVWSCHISNWNQKWVFHRVG